MILSVSEARGLIYFGEGGPNSVNSSQSSIEFGLPKSPADRGGFSLIELMAVVTILAIITTVAIFNFRLPWQKARFAHVIERILDLDDRARRSALSRSREHQIIVDISEQEIRTDRWDDEHQRWITMKLPTDIRINRAITRDGEIDGGVLLLSVSPFGFTTSYALEIRSSQQTEWVSIYGGTGQAWRSENALEIQKMYSIMETSGIDSN